MTDTFYSWLGSLPRWQQTAAANLLRQQRLPTPEEIGQLADLCLAEAGRQPAAFAAVPPAAFDTTPIGAQVRVNRIEAITGVNALQPGAALDVTGADLAVVYGPNGSGKSGFVRLLKHAAGTRNPGSLFSDVFNSPVQQRATFIIQRDGRPFAETWTPASGPVRSLQRLHVFDNEAARVYLTAKAEASYEPRRLRFLTTLAGICDNVRLDLEKRKAQHPPRLPMIPPELETTALAEFVTHLQPWQTESEVAERCSPQAGHASRLAELQEALRAPDPAAQIDAVRKSLANLAAVAQSTADLAAAYSGSAADELLAANAAAREARQAADEAAARVFSTSNLAGVGAATWRMMWEAARKYSMETAYPGREFPCAGEGARCPLCQQPLEPTAQARFAHFDAFIRSDVERRAGEAEERCRRLAMGLPVLPSSADWAARFIAVPGAEDIAAALYMALAARRAILTADDRGEEELPPADFVLLQDLIELQREVLQKELTLLAAAADTGKRQAMEDEVRALDMLGWCQANIEAILEELSRIKALAVLDAAVKSANTASITRKKGQLAKEELTGGYQARFLDELRELGGGRIPVQPVEASRSKGKIEFALAIAGASQPVKPAQFLSEGEGRIAALAAFLADVTVAGARTPFVFDDPISSLDKDFSARVARRLIALAKTRQVLVFTHRISLVNLLRKLGKQDGQGLAMREIGLRRAGDTTGVAGEIP